jgi:preprotein translocase subunit SecE
MAVSRKIRRDMERSQAKKAAAPTPKKKIQPGAPAKKRTTPIQFLKEVRAELKKVAWPTRTELLQSTIMVVVILSTVTVIVYLMDTVFSQATTFLTQ